MLRELRVLPPFGKSDHVGLLALFNTRTDKRLVKSVIRQWGKVKPADLISWVVFFVRFA